MSLGNSCLQILLLHIQPNVRKGYPREGDSNPGRGRPCDHTSRRAGVCKNSCRRPTCSGNSGLDTACSQDWRQCSNFLEDFSVTTNGVWQWPLYPQEGPGSSDTTSAASPLPLATCGQGGSIWLVSCPFMDPKKFGSRIPTGFVLDHSVGWPRRASLISVCHTN